MDEALKDERFSHIFSDPRFRRIPKNVKKIKVDNRFKNIFKSKKFNQRCHVDERGRSLDLNPSENLEKLYNLDQESDTDESTNSKSNASQHLKKSSKTVKKSKKNDADYNKNDEASLSNSIGSNLYGNEEEMSAAKQISKTKNIIKSDTKLNVKSKYLKPKLDLTKKSAFEKDVKLDPRFQIKSDSEQELVSSNSENEDTSDENGSNLEEESEAESTSSEDESEVSDSDSEKSDSFDHEWEEQHEKAPDANVTTKRLAVCNMDWDRIRAVDLFAVFNSFKPPDSTILSVKIYPSEYGLKRMEEEKLKGPIELVEKKLDLDEEEVEDKKGGKYHREKLRQYQMNRLKYYYAVVECDTPETAGTLYNELNGMEYESSSVRFDLRFVPDDMTFDQEPSSSAGNTTELTEYKPKLFVTTALQQVKVGLTWDETDPRRRETLQKAFTEPDTIEKDIKEYLASSSGDSEEEEIENEEDGLKTSTKQRIEKYKALLESLNEEEKEKNEEKFDMEITWETGAKEKTENLVKEKLEEKTITPFEELQKKKREKQKLKKKEKNMKTNNEDESDNTASDLDDSIEEKDIKKVESKSSKKTAELYLISDSKLLDDSNTLTSKKKKKNKKNKKSKQETSDGVQIDVNDPRFSAIYTSPLFNIDPSNPHFKNTPGNMAIIAEKQRRLKNKINSGYETSNKKFKY